MVRPKSAVKPFPEKQKSLFHREALRAWETHKQIAHISVMELMSIILEVVCEGDMPALKGFLESDVVRKGHFITEQIRALWKLCWQVRGEFNPVSHVLLDTMMACLQSAYPTVCGYPEGIIMSDLGEG